MRCLRELAALLTLATALAGCATNVEADDAEGVQPADPPIASSAMPAVSDPCQSISDDAAAAYDVCMKKKARCEHLSGAASLRVCKDALDSCEHAQRLTEEAVKCLQEHASR